MLNLGFYWRNCDLYGNPLGPGEELPNGVFKYTNDEFSLAVLISNVLRNAAIHIGTSRKINVKLEQTMSAAYDALGASISDPKTTWSGTAFQIPAIKYDEGADGNPFHFFLFGCCALAFVSRRGQDRVAGLYIVGLIAGFLVVCLLLKWQPWNSRLHLPLFILGSPIVGLTLATLRSRRLVYLVAALLIIGSLPYLLWNQSRPILKRHNVINTTRSNDTSLPAPISMSLLPGSRIGAWQRLSRYRADSRNRWLGISDMGGASTICVALDRYTACWNHEHF